MRARAVVLDGPRGGIAVRDVEVGEPGPGEILVRMEACGICHSDLFVAGLEKLPLAPLTLGHEGIGRNVATGERVGITFLADTCGGCEPCRDGVERYCSRQVNAGFTAHGALAEFAIARAAHVARIPDGLDPVDAAPLCCAGWTAYGAIREAGLTAGQTVGLFGLGGLGHLAIHYARLKGLRVAAVDLSDEKLRQARSLGAEWAVGAETAGKTLQKEIGGVDAAIVLTGSPAAITQAFRSVKRTGSVVLVGLSSNQYELPIVDTVLKGIRIRGSYLGTDEDLAEVMRLGAKGLVRPHVEAFGIEEAPTLLERLRAGQISGRAVIRF